MLQARYGIIFPASYLHALIANPPHNDVCAMQCNVQASSHSSSSLHVKAAVELTCFLWGAVELEK